MAVYVIGTLISVFFMWVYQALSKSKLQYVKNGIYHPKVYSSIFVFLSFLSLTVISAVRFNVGSDYPSYYALYAIPSSEDRYMQDEPFFALFVQALKKVSVNPQFFFAITSIIICGSYFIVICKESENKALSILLFVLTQDYFIAMNGIRQYLAIAILLFSLPAIITGKRKRAVLFLIVAYLFHNSAFVYLLFFIILWFSFTPLFLFTAAVISFSMLTTIKDIIFPIVNKYTHYGKFFLYTSEYSKSRFSTTVFLTSCMIFLLVVYVFYFENSKRDAKIKILLSSSFMGVIFSIFSLVFPQNLGRLGWYTNSVVIIYVPHLLKNIKSKKLQNVITVCLVMVYMSGCIYCILKGNHDVLPYTTIWE